MLTVLADLYPDAPIYTSWFDNEIVNAHFHGRRIYTSFLNSVPGIKKLYRIFIPLLPLAFKLMNLKRFDKVFVISDEFEKMVRVKPQSEKILYILTPPRFLWLQAEKKSRGLIETVYRILLRKSLSFIWKRLDRRAASTASQVSSISEEVKKRVQKFYSIRSSVIYPPVDVDEIPFNPGQRSNEFLYLGRVEEYKGVELAIRACIRSKLRLKVAGIGSDLERLMKLVRQMKAEDLITFEGFVYGESKFKLYSQAKALIFPVVEEDFGIVPVEANAAGCPVIAHRSGGVQETIVEGETGLFFDTYSEEALGEVLMKFNSARFSAEKCRANAMKFSRKIFENNIRGLIDGAEKG